MLVDVYGIVLSFGWEERSFVLAYVLKHVLRCGVLIRHNYIPLGHEHCLIQLHHLTIIRTQSFDMDSGRFVHSLQFNVIDLYGLKALKVFYVSEGASFIRLPRFGFS